MMEPPPPAIIGLTTERMPRKVPIWLIRITRSYCASVVSASAEKNKMPALFTKTSTPPRFCTTSSTTAVQSSSLDTSRRR